MSLALQGNNKEIAMTCLNRPYTTLLQGNATRQYCLARLEERTPWISS
jgi:hypothetical protein